MVPKRRYFLLSRWLRQKSWSKYLQLAILTVFVWNGGQNIIRLHHQKNDMQVLQFRDPQARFSHLDFVNPETDVIKMGFAGIDAVHRQGKLHSGSWIQVVDTSMVANPRLLLMKRREHLVTCPNAWGLVGEHSYRNELPRATVRRALKEELGARLLDHVDRVGTIRNLAAHPVVYKRDYGPSNGGRIDHQITYLWLVELNLEGSDRADELMDLDDEVADHKWVALGELENWIEAEKSSSPPRDFCHETIVSLLSLVIERLKSLSDQ